MSRRINIIGGEISVYDSNTVLILIHNQDSDKIIFISASIADNKTTWKEFDSFEGTTFYFGIIL